MGLAVVLVGVGARLLVEGGGVMRLECLQREKGPNFGDSGFRWLQFLENRRNAGGLKLY